MNFLHPTLVLFVTALGALLTQRVVRKWILVIGTSISIISCSWLTPLSNFNLSFSRLTLSPLHVDKLSLVFGLVLTLVTLIGIIYALHNENRGEQVMTLLYAGSSIGVIFAGDWITLFIFWELMAITSLFVIWYGGTHRSGKAGYRYLLIHMLGGSLLFTGILFHIGGTGDTTIAPLSTAGAGIATFTLILLGVAINTAIPPLHAWLTDAYPEASISGSVFLSAFTTKTAVYVLIRVFPGAEILIWAGVIMALYGVAYAVLENDIRRLLAYHIVSQVGYMVAGVGMGTQLALNGATAHAFSHILYKSLLFMGAGAVLYATGRRKLTELGGIAPKMKLVVFLYMVGALSISGMPLWNGFISKSMIISAAAESHRPFSELFLYLASVGTFLHTGLKLPYFTFFGPSRKLPLKKIPPNMIVSMTIGATLCTLYGLYPNLLYNLLPFESKYQPYTIDHVVSALQLLIGTGIGFWILIDRLGGETMLSLDTDWFYRHPLQKITQTISEGARRFGEATHVLSLRIVQYCLPTINRALLPFNAIPDDEAADDYDENRFRYPIGSTISWIVLSFVLITLYTQLRGCI